MSDLFERPSSREVRERRKQSAIKASGDQQSESEAAAAGTNPPGWMAFSLAFVLFIPAGCSLTLSAWGLGCLVAYLKMLPAVFRAFPGSFSFGEGCVALQALALFAFEAPAAILAFTDDPSTLSGKCHNVISGTAQDTFDPFLKTV